MLTHIDEEKVKRFASIFDGRKDARGLAHGECARGEVTLDHYRRHLQGEESLGVYPLMPDSTCRFGAVDIDRKDPTLAKAVYDALTALELPFGVYMEQSRGKGYHVWLFADEAITAREMRRILRRAVLDAGLPETTEIFPKQADAETVEFGNYINLPYFGETDGPRMVLSRGSLQPMPLPRFLTVCRPAPASIVRSIASRIADRSPAGPAPGPKENWLVDAWGGADAGRRNDTAARLAGYLKSRRVPEDLALAMLEDWRLKCEHDSGQPFDDKELRGVVTGIYRRHGGIDPGEQALPGARRFDVEPLSFFLQRAPEKVEWLIEPFIPKGGMALISGDPGAGKTWLALDAAISVASGRDWLGRYRTAQGPVILIDEETTHAGLSSRMNMLLVGTGDKPDDLPIFIALRQGLNLSDSRQAERLAGVIDRVRPALVVFDPFAEMHDGSENSADEVARVFRTMREAGRPHDPAFLVIHHNRKNDEMYRGSSHIEATLDTRLSVSALEGGITKVKHTKARYSDKLSAFAVKREITDEMAHLTLIELPSDATESERGRTGPAVDRAVHEIEEFLTWKRGQLVPKADLLAALEPEGIKPASVDAALRRLEGQGKVIRKPDPDNGRHRLVGWVEPAGDELVEGSPISSNGGEPKPAGV